MSTKYTKKHEKGKGLKKANKWEGIFTFRVFSCLSWKKIVLKRHPPHFYVVSSVWWYCSLMSYQPPNALVACFEKDVSEALVKALAKREPLRAVFRDSGYSSDSTKINIEQIFKLTSPATEVEAI